MKKIKNIKLMLVLAFVLLFDNIPTLAATGNYDSQIEKDAKEYSDFSKFSDKAANPFADGSRYFTVTEDNNHYYVDVNGTKLEIIASDTSDPAIKPSNTSEISNRQKNIVDSSFSLAKDYINDSQVLQNKDDIIDFLTQMPVMEADFDTNSDIGALFSPDDARIYINRANNEFVCEWMILHEYIHAIAFITHGKTIGTYGYNVFNEILTDIITNSLAPSINDTIESGYKPLYPLVYPYIDIFKNSWANAYFYEYDTIYSKASKDEMDFFVITLENYGQGDSVALYNNIILKWYANV